MKEEPLMFNQAERLPAEERVVNEALNNDEEMLEMIAEHLRSQENLDRDLIEREELIQRVHATYRDVPSVENIKYDKDYNLAGAETKYLDYLKKDGISDDELSAILKTDEYISRLEKLKYGNLTNVDREKNQKYLEILNNKKDSLLESINARLEMSKSALLNELIGESSRYAANLQKIKEIEENPEIIDRLVAMATEEYENMNREIEKSFEDVLKNALPYLASFSTKNKNALAKINHLYGEDVGEYLLEGKDLEILITKIRKKLVAEIMLKTGTEQTIKEPSDIVPWSIKTGIPYSKSLTELNKPSLKAALKELIKRQNKVGIDFNTKLNEELELNRILHDIFETYKEVKYSEFAKSVTFKNSFDQRLKNDQSGLTEEIINKTKTKELNLKNRAEKVQKEIHGILAQDGFEVTDDQHHSGAVLIEEFTSEKGNPTLKIIAVAGGIDPSLVGRVSPTNWKSFPQYIQKAPEKKVSTPALS